MSKYAQLRMTLNQWSTVIENMLEDGCEFEVVWMDSCGDEKELGYAICCGCELFEYGFESESEAERRIEDMLSEYELSKGKVLFEEILEDKKVGNILDNLNLAYDYEFYRADSGLFIREDLQQNDRIENIKIDDIVAFYIDAIESKLDYEDLDDCIPMRKDLAALKEYKKIINNK